MSKIEYESISRQINKGLRICLLKPRDTNVYDMHIESKLFPQSIRRNIALMKLMFDKILDEKSGSTPGGERIRTRGDAQIKLPVPFPRSSWFHRSVTYQGPSRSLALPKFLKVFESIEFSKAIKEWYLSEILLSGVV